MARRVLKIFARGNVDVKDSLLWSRVGGVVQWNGIGEVLRARHPDVVAKVRHETCARTDLIPLPGEELPGPPPALAERFPATGHPIAKQHRTAMWDAPADAVVLSLQSGMTNALVRHRQEGWLYLPDEVEAWTKEQRAGLRADFESAGLAPLDEVMRRLEALVLAIEERLGAHVLVYNLSPVVPGDRTHTWLGAEDALQLRVRRFNLALAELSARLGFSIVDVERLCACAGAERVKVDLFHLTAEGYRLVAEEVVRILEDRGWFDSPEEPR